MTPTQGGHSHPLSQTVEGGSGGLPDGEERTGAVGWEGVWVQVRPEVGEEGERDLGKRQRLH